MSLLLDALRKADRERRSGQPVSPFDAPTDPPKVSEPRSGQSQHSQRALIAVLWGLLIAVLLLALVIWQRSPEVGQAKPSAQAAPAPVPTALVTITPAPRLPPPADLPFTPEPEPFESLYSLDDLAMPALQSVDATPPLPVASAAPALVIAEVVPTPGSAFLPPLPEAEPPAPATAASDVIQRRDLPAADRDRIPHYVIDVHVYNDDPARRFILIRGERFGEGSILEGGHRLLEIAPRGLIIDLDGQKVLIPRPG